MTETILKQGTVMSERKKSISIFCTPVRNPKYDFDLPESESNPMWNYQIVKTVNTICEMYRDYSKNEINAWIDSGIQVTINKNV